MLLLCEGKASTYREFLPHFFSEDSLDSAHFHLQEWGHIEPPEADANPAEYLDEAVIFTPTEGGLLRASDTFRRVLVK